MQPSPGQAPNSQWPLRFSGGPSVTAQNVQMVHNAKHPCADGVPRSKAEPPECRAPAGQAWAACPPTPHPVPGCCPSPTPFVCKQEVTVSTLQGWKGERWWKYRTSPRAHTRQVLNKRWALPTAGTATLTFSHDPQLKLLAKLGVEPESNCFRG